MKYEYMVYKTTKIPLIGKGITIQQKLNEFGNQGWELITVEWKNPWTVNVLFISFTWIQRDHVFYFKRKKGDKK